LKKLIMLLTAQYAYDIEPPNQGITGVHHKRHKAVQGKVEDELVDVQKAYETLFKEASRPRRTRQRTDAADDNWQKPQPRLNPNARLEELLKSLDEYRVELQSVVEDSEPNTADRLICQAMHTQAGDMITRLKDFTKHPTYGDLFKPGGTDPIPTEKVLASLKLCQTPLAEPPAPTDKPTYDVLMRNHQPERPAVCTGLELENRVYRLESKCVGDYLSQKVNYPDLLSAVEFTKTRLETVYRSAKLRRHNSSKFEKMTVDLRKLEDALYQRPNFGRYGQESRFQDHLFGLMEQKEDPDEKKLAVLTETFNKGAPKIAALRRVTERFECLADVHTCLGTFIGDVVTSVDAHSRLLEEVQQYREVLRRSIESFQTNERKMRENFAKLDERLKALGA